MISTYKLRDVTWHDLENPSESEIRQIVADYEIPSEAADDILSPTPKLRVLPFANCVYIVMHFPNLNTGKEEKRREIDFIIGKKFFITVHYDQARSVKKFASSAKAEEIFDKPNTEENGGFVFHKLMRHLYQYLLSDIDRMREGLNKAEKSIFLGEEKKMVVELSKIHRDILRFKTAISPHREAIALLFGVFRNFLGEQYEYHIHDMSSEYQRVERRIQSNKDLLDELRLTNDSLLSAKQNEAIKGLTMMAFITFPLSLTAAIFTMETHTKPIVGMQNDFWVIIGIMAAIAFACLAYFSHKKWL